MNEIIKYSKDDVVELIWETVPRLKRLLRNAKDRHEAREEYSRYMSRLEQHYFNIYSDRPYKDMHILVKNVAKECIRVLKNVSRTENEQLTGFSAFRILYSLAKGKVNVLERIDKGFLVEFLYLFRGAVGKSDIPGAIYDHYSFSEGKKGAKRRSKRLNLYANNMQKYIAKNYISGFDSEVVQYREKLRDDILEYYKSDIEDWYDYRWHLKHIIKDMKTVSSLIKLEDDEILGLEVAHRYNIPVHITPYYLSLFNRDGRTVHDRSLRAQVIPTVEYCENIYKGRVSGEDLDFMQEKSTSPVDCITRRYPQIVILKPYDSCPQICVYCQRNWEIKGMDEAKITRKVIKEAVKWIKENSAITEVLITGGDPLTLRNETLNSILRDVAQIDHVDRIRIGTRSLVTMPFRINDGLLELLRKYHEWGKREVCIMTHFEYPSEITGDVLDAVKRIKQLGINIYNQQVYTYYNSRKYMTSYLRKMLKLSGIDPYYTFNTKGKEETLNFRVPIARIEQERKEEARLLPGLERTDEPVFNVPRLGKSHLRSWQDHEPIMILPDGSRVYRFYPWEAKLKISDDYIYTDVPIYDYIKRLHSDGDNLNDYKTIWYYF